MKRFYRQINFIINEINLIILSLISCKVINFKLYEQGLECKKAVVKNKKGQEIIF